MKRTAKEQVYDYLLSIQSELLEKKITTKVISEELNLSRSVTSLYLNQLQQEGLLIKKPGKPVLWNLVYPVLASREEVTEDIFENFIGATGSQKNAVNKCKAAVLYPPNGLNILITGESGVGKSYFASLIYEYAKQKRIVSQEAPFCVLNCADYANNPELLSSALFGHKAGSFTGANENKVGLLKEADGGYLFLDEVHRLSGENQEKLFTFMDTSTFRPLGENLEFTTSNVHFIFATTEDPKQVLLETFNRRVPVVSNLSNFEKRPFGERFQLVEFLFFQEAKKINRDLIIAPEVLNILCFHVFQGNIGKLKNNIKVSCAKAFRKNRNSKTLKITLLELETNSILSPIASNKILTEPIYLNHKENPNFDIPLDKDDLERQLNNLWEKIINDSQRNKYKTSIYINTIKTINHHFFDGTHPYTQKEFALNGWDNLCVLEIEQMLTQNFGISDSKIIVENLNPFFQSNQLSFNIMLDIQKIFMEKYPRSYRVAIYCIEKLNEKVNNEVKHDLICGLTLLLTEFVDDSIILPALMVAHGDDTATSIQKVVNQLCGNYVFDAIDMPIETTVDDISKEAIKLVQQTDTSRGFILLVDMGSLNQLYSSIKKYIDGDLLVINNLTTAIGLDIGIKIMNQTSFKEIAKDATKYEINTQYYEGFSQSKNIIVSCMSGLGIAEKIKDIISKYVSSEIEVISIEYSKLKELIYTNDEQYFSESQFIITTTNLREDSYIPHLNIYNILDKKGEKDFFELIKPWIGDYDFAKMMKLLVHFFSFEGVQERLQFLNPEIVLQQVENVMSQYENYYHLDITGKEKLNLYMHISLMIERLVFDKIEVEEVTINDKLEEEIKFHQLSSNFFYEIENTYNIKINQYEISLLYELIKALY